MNLYLITQTERCGFDTFDSAVVCAKTAKDAVRINPSGRSFSKEAEGPYGLWASSPDNVTAKLVGRAAKGVEEGDIICASFNAG